MQLHTYSGLHATISVTNIACARCSRGRGKKGPKKASGDDGDDDGDGDEGGGGGGFRKRMATVRMMMKGEGGREQVRLVCK